MVEALALYGYGRDHPAVAKAYRYLRSEQESDGSWFGRWGVNHIYGTAAVLPALAAIGEDMNAQYVRRAADWLIAHQNDDGGWGESCASYMDDRLRGVGTSTASQTAWALMALLATGQRDHDGALTRGLEFLTRTQRSDGTWDEPYYTGTGFPGYGFGARMDFRDARTRERIAQGTELQRGFMINYNLYRHYFPLMALGRARTHLRDSL
jgi:squalene-hopene/tetraprenyl-beta-curcumene cyclase